MKRVYSLWVFVTLFYPLSAAAQTDFWQPTNGPYGGASVFAIDSSGYVFAGTGNGVFRSTDNGASWTEINNGVTDRIVRALAINSSGHIFAGTERSRIFRSTDHGESWTSNKSGLNYCSVYALAVNSSGHIFAAARPDDAGGVFRSTDNGESWTEIGLNGITVQALAINSRGHIFAVAAVHEGTDSVGVLRSTDNGKSWVPVNNGLTDQDIQSFAINSHGDVFAMTLRGIFRSTDNGGSWNQVFLSSETKVRAVAINYRGHLFMGTYGSGSFHTTDAGNWRETERGGVFHSTDNGESWTPVSAGLTNTDVQCLAIDSNGHVFVGTGGFFEGTGGGVFRSVQSTTSVIRNR